jgi:hypothetical protein
MERRFKIWERAVQPFGSARSSRKNRVRFFAPRIPARMRQRPKRSLAALAQLTGQHHTIDFSLHTLASMCKSKPPIHVATGVGAERSGGITAHATVPATVMQGAVRQTLQNIRVRKSGILSLRGTGRGVWPLDGSNRGAKLRDEWQA